MDALVKFPQRQDCDLKLTPGNSGETSINLSTEIALFLSNGESLLKGDELNVSFTIYKEDYIKALCHLTGLLPLYRTSSTKYTEIPYSFQLFDSLYKSISNYFGEEETAKYEVVLSAVSAPRYYLKDLNQNGFNFRKFLIEGNSKMIFSEGSTGFELRLESGNNIEEADSVEPVLLLKEKKLLYFIYKVTKHIEENDSLNNMLPYITINSSIYKVSCQDVFSLTGMFIKTTIDDIKNRNVLQRRWFEESTFKLGEDDVYLSTQWNSKGNYQLTLDDFKAMLQKCYPDKYAVKINDSGEFELWSPCSNDTEADISTPIEAKDFNLTEIISSIKETGLLYSDDLIKRFAYALMSKPFVILSGLAGSGKTQLALAFAKCLCEDINNQVCTVSVGADWTNREPLLGYPNALKTEEYVKPESGVLDLLIDAKDNPNKPYFLILDEMNLSVVERYFADFLSAMESHESIKLWTGENDVPKEIALPKNLYIIGTINVDETTYMFSPKVLDRANVIEFKIAEEEMKQFLNEKKVIDRTACYSACANMAQDFLNRTQECKESTDTSKIVKTLNDFFAKLKCVNAEFGYRTVNEIYRYISNVGNDLGEYGAIDTAILQKLLPKLHGPRKKMAPVLTALWALCFNDADKVAKIENVKEFDEVKDKEYLIYKYSAEKILRMYKAVVDNGFTSFAEA